MDSATLRCSKTTFARVCIEVEASKPLPDSISVEISPGFKERFRVEYDWKPHACQFCKTFGHDENRCCKKPTLPSLMTPATQFPTVNDGQNTVLPTAYSDHSSLKGKEKVGEHVQEETPFQSPKKTANKLLSAAQKASTRHVYAPKKKITPPSNNFCVLKEMVDIPNPVGQSISSVPSGPSCFTKESIALPSVEEAPQVSLTAAAPCHGGHSYPCTSLPQKTNRSPSGYQSGGFITN
ncbi:hypothetical protein QJS10_CPA10g01456 [Acorus calamus]|uniref:Zinc knuckle CX2CX4HX4C domain-containing protein n=1 Tax=Acorus calamus TaxID=4465 RepID=A0AAV9DXW7_ACOCL|nr:hypothetical protein QJS10_CPA10g01456 [Acorus calamus]